MTLVTLRWSDKSVIFEMSTTTYRQEKTPLSPFLFEKKKNLPKWVLFIGMLFFYFLLWMVLIEALGQEEAHLCSEIFVQSML